MTQYSPQQIKFITENFQKGQKSLQSGNFSKAEKFYLAILKIDSEIIDAKNALAYIYATTKQHNKAINQLKNILVSNPDSANIHHNLANILSEVHSYDEAIIHYQTAISLFRKYKLARSR